MISRETRTQNLLWTALAALVAVAVAGIAPAAKAAADTPLPQVTIPGPSAAEQEHLRKLDAALAPLKAVSVSQADADHVKNAAAAVQSGNLSKLGSEKGAITDPTARKLVEWIALRAGYGEAAEYKKFLTDNPMWPDRTMMTQRLEEALFTQGGTVQSIKGYFIDSEPQTGIGYAALASAYLAEGKADKARELASKAWRELTIPATLENGFLARFGKMLTPADHKWRFDRMVTDDVRWADNRAERVAFARRVIPLLAPDQQKIATARLAVFSRAANARALLNAVDATHENDTGLAFHRAQLLRKQGKVEEAAKIILAIPPDPKQIAVLDEWWAERRDLAYGAVKAGKVKLAYDLAKDAGPLSVNPLKEQTFLAGWIAFRFLKDYKAAEKHFSALADAADGPLSRAKAAYWLGRVDDARGRKDDARRHYEVATKNPDTFHGLLAMQMLNPKKTSLDITPPQFPSASEISKFVSLDAAKAAMIASQAKLSRWYSRSFLMSLRANLPSEAEAGLVSHLALMLGDPQISLRIAKAAVAKGQNLITYAYPVQPFPSYKPLRSPPELAFLLAIARQETEFEPQTVSGAGAKGLLQVMTITANHVCRDYKIRCEIGRLLSDSQYNVMIASAYIADRMEEFGGSYVLGLAGYNAGPGRARQWIRENGDPRTSDIDPIDWIENIPITETREYVTKVLSNIQIYRARLGDSSNALRIKQDLQRARGNGKVPRSEEPAQAGSSGSEG